MARSAECVPAGQGQGGAPVSGGGTLALARPGRGAGLC